MTISNTMEAQWHQIKGLIKQKWNNLTDDEIEAMKGNKEQLVGKVMSKFDMTKEEAEKEVNRFWK
jgi:uncharacterized protein YjbJ (UPF0337 family)